MAKPEKHKSYTRPVAGHIAFGGFRKICICFDGDQIDALNDLAKEKNKSFSATVNEIVSNYLKGK